VRSKLVDVFGVMLSKGAAAIFRLGVSRLQSSFSGATVVRVASELSATSRHVALQTRWLGDANHPHRGPNAANTREEGIPTIEFEDIFEHVASFTMNRQDDTGMQAEQDRDLKRLNPEPMPDEELLVTDVRELSRPQLIWAATRLSYLKVTDANSWRGITQAVAEIGEAKLTPSELCRLMLAFGYAPIQAELDEAQLQRLLRAFARRVKEYSDERVIRVIYGYAKLAKKRSISARKFVDFASSEVIERAIKMRAWRKLQVLNAVWHLPGAGDEFRTMVVSQVMKNISNLDAESIRNFIPLLVETGVHQRGGVVQKLNLKVRNKFFGLQSARLVLRAGSRMVFHDLFQGSLLTDWLLRLCDLRLPIADGVTVTGEAPGDTSGPSDAYRACENLEELKIVEMCIRHEHGPVYQTLPPKVLGLLETARRTPLQPPDDYRMLEPPFIYAELRRLSRSLRLVMHPIVYGPYLLDIADPFGKNVIEWDCSWELYPSHERNVHKSFVLQKHRHLRAEGWKVVCLPLAEFRKLESHEAKQQLLEHHVVEHKLDHLRLMG